MKHKEEQQKLKQVRQARNRLETRIKKAARGGEERKETVGKMRGREEIKTAGFSVCMLSVSQPSA